MKYLACAEFEPNSTTVCINQVWLDEPSLIPDLSVEDGAALGAAVFGAFFVAWIFRTLGRIAQKH